MQVKDYKKHPKNIVTEFEISSLAINIGSSANPLKKVDFDAVFRSLSFGTHNQKQSGTSHH